MEKISKPKIRKWDEVSGAVEDNDEVLLNDCTENPGAGPSVSRNYMRGIEDMVEQNDNNFDGVINNLPEQNPVPHMNTTDVLGEDHKKKSILRKLQEVEYDATNPKTVEPCCICNAMERF